LPVPAGPTIATALVPWTVSPISLSSCLPPPFGPGPPGVATICLSAREGKMLVLTRNRIRRSNFLQRVVAALRGFD